MISLHNISKTYVAKSKAQTHALKDVSLNIADRGFVFILGKSGSGKSTLLNLLVGLDSPTAGEIFVDGVSMNQFTQRDFDAYRNNYVGFVFQEFNLLADFNVRDNVALALKLSQSDNIDSKVVDALKQVELNEDYLSRRIDEMSGGEKQRIAIARAIIKDSKIVLADEPTGNLDSATGESIWNILKTLSRTRLVVVVSHDRESAEKYADRIIEISDGQIVADNGLIPPQDDVVSKNFVAVKQRLSFGTRLKMGYNTLKLRKAKTASVILLAIFSILSVLILQMCLSFSSELTLAKYMARNNVDYFQVAQGKISGFDNIFQSQQCIWKNSTKEYISNNSRFIKNGIIESKQDILDFGLTFVGDSLELDDNSYYATLTAIEKNYDTGLAKVEVDGEFVEVVRELHPIEFLIGKKVDLHFAFEEPCEWVLAGVIDTENIVNIEALPSYFCNKNFGGASYVSSIYFNRGDPKEVTLQLSNTEIDDEFGIDQSLTRHLMYESSVIVTADGIITRYDCYDHGFELADNEIVLPYEMYAKFFDVQSKWYYISSDLTELHNIPQEIGQTMDLKFYEYDTGELLADYGEVKLVGVVFALSWPTESFANDIILSKKLVRNVCQDLRPLSIVIQTASLKNLNDFVWTLRKDYNGFIYGIGSVEAVSLTGQTTMEIDLAEMTYEFELIILLLSVVFLIIVLVLTVILVLLVINLISFSIANRKREVGILSALGTSNGDITSIFLFETLIISAISFVATLALFFVLTWVLNKVISRAYLLTFTFPFMRVDVLTIVTAIVAAFGLPLLAALIPARKIINLKPIDAIRNN